MPNNPNNTTTTLNPGVAGDSMNESLTPQPIDVTQPAVTQTSAKSPRVVMIDDAGQLLDFVLENGIQTLPISALSLASKLDKVIELLSKINVKLAKMSG